MFQNHNKKPFQSSSSLSIPAFFCIFGIIYTFFYSVTVILKFYSICFPGYQRFSSRAARSFVGRRPKTRAWPKPKTAHGKPLAHRVSIYWQGWGGNVALSWLMRYPPPTHHSFRHEESLSFKMFYSYFCKFLFVLFTFLNFRWASWVILTCL